MIVALGVHGSGLAPRPLAADRRAFTVGAGAGDLVVPGAADVHAIVERVGDALRVTAVADRPIYRSPWTASVREVLLYAGAGAVAWLGEVPLLALDESMMRLRPRLAWSMGLDAAGPVDARSSRSRTARRSSFWDRAISTMTRSLPRSTAPPCASISTSRARYQRRRPLACSPRAETRASCCARPKRTTRGPCSTPTPTA